MFLKHGFLNSFQLGVSVSGLLLMAIVMTALVADLLLLTVYSKQIPEPPKQSDNE
jgi:hypothetical protein